jgi:hypothetical protein
VLSLFPDAPPKTYMKEEVFTDNLFPGLKLTAEDVFKMAKIPTK